ncbi:ImmA/IrrE family metallo-endopeptidase [Pontibacter sp. JH31]|uniref:ImmA/IrrE family metallo-endopeptidase n=1 Tax=Pontibacter aquaedesilientis TaxID=2766980 RepID=A0ABR7XBU0_9BACT|nr:ImmA/IrrE family metallo-endopeptidase [Pontibacter aquaedesilientis]MBD1395764.1 ImmA/IrrE family metallo-endopeptidase [Pontibacter aquaedesilientis]
MKTEININTDILVWAITRAGYQLHEFAPKFPRILDWLDNKKTPTVKQLQDFSNKVHIPFGYLFLKEPPKEDIPFPFFRTGNTETTKVSLNVYETILIVQRRQDWLKEYLQEHDFKALPFVGKFEEVNDYLKIVEDIRSTLGLENDWASNFKRYEDTLEFITQAIEEIGIIVNFNSIVENNTSRPIKVEECRGFVLVDDIAPFMFINSADGKAAQLFTIIHELAHIWTGKSAGFDFRQLLPANDPIEQLCDKVAAEFLVPAESFNAIWQVKPDIIYIAKHFKVSPIVVARRALDLSKITKPAFFQFYNSYVSEVKFRKENQKGGGDFYATQKKRLSLSFAAHVDRAVKEQSLLYRDAYKITGLRGETYQNFINQKLYSN